MGKEIERKFLVKPGLIGNLPEAVIITQGYLSVDPLRTVRLRIYGEKAFLTVKSQADSASLVRSEWAVDIGLQCV